MQTVADKFLLAVDDHLRGIWSWDAKPASVLLMTIRIFTRGKPVAPSRPIPIVHVFAENDDLALRSRSLRVKLAQEFVGGRTARASFGRKEFHENSRGR